MMEESRETERRRVWGKTGVGGGGGGDWLHPLFLFLLESKLKRYPPLPYADLPRKAPYASEIQQAILEANTE